MGILLLPNSPFSWTWYGNTTPSSNASHFNRLYEYGDVQALAESSTRANITVAAAFKDCPAERVCEEGSDNFSFADLQSHIGGNLTAPSVMTSHVTWTIEENTSGVDRHSLWYRRV